MTARIKLKLTDQAFSAMAGYAVEAYPEECCGVILSDAIRDEVRPLNNIQNVLHEKDPETFPRDARTAYTIDYRVLDELLTEADHRGLRIKAFYHSHPDHEAYFSEEDKGFAMPFGEPTYPDTAQVVMSVSGAGVRRVGVYMWDAIVRDFVEIEMEKSADR